MWHGLTLTDFSNTLYLLLGFIFGRVTGRAAVRTEEARQIAEQVRELSETHRNAAESGRASAEDDRDEAEQERRKDAGQQPT